MDELDKRRREIIQVIERIRAEYEKAVQPYMRMLYEIEAIRPPPPIVVPADWFPLQVKGNEETAYQD